MARILRPFPVFTICLSRCSVCCSIRKCTTSRKTKTIHYNLKNMQQNIVNEKATHVHYKEKKIIMSLTMLGYKNYFIHFTPHFQRCIIFGGSLIVHNIRPFQRNCNYTKQRDKIVHGPMSFKGGKKIYLHTYIAYNFKKYMYVVVNYKTQMKMY